MARIWILSTGIGDFVDRVPILWVADIERFEDRRDERVDDSVIESVDPAVDGHFLAMFPSVLKDGGMGDVARLGEHVEFTESVTGGLGREGVEFTTVHPAECANAG